jgi:hypothetical protein
VQVVAVVQETLVRWLTTPSVGLGVGSIVHALPSQCSARVRSGPVLTVQYPTAVQSLADVQDTLDSWPPLFPAGRGTAWLVQAVPFHLSASAEGLLEPCESPTAQTAVDPSDPPPSN